MNSTMESSMATTTEEAGGTWKLDVESKLLSENFKVNFVKELLGKDVSVSFFQREGFLNPIHVPDKEGLALRVPHFTVPEIRAAIGSRKLIKVLNVKTQQMTTMMMKDWQKYFEENTEKKRFQILDVTSLEFSNTKLDPYVTSPRVVRQIDWCDKVWPPHLKEMFLQPSSSSSSCERPVDDPAGDDDMTTYPKVQKYCVMSVKGSFTNFHIDFGGSSIWYHIVKGSKTFWLIPPTDENLKYYEDWVLSQRQNELFFGDNVNHCGRYHMRAGSTMFIPSGWIYADYTTMDTIAFKGHFLHSFGIEKQLQVAFIEEIIKLPVSMRYPFFTEVLWYTLDRYLQRLTGKTHLDLPEDEKRRMRLERGHHIDPNKEFLFKNGGSLEVPPQHLHLTQTELQGIKFIVMYLHQLPPNKKNVPVMLPNPVAIIKDIRALVVDHKDDCPEKAITGRSIVRWTENDDVEPGSKRHLKKVEKAKPTPISKQILRKASSTANRRRRVRCKVCQACVGGDCKTCVYCKDMTKYGGPGRMKQTCEKRRCLQPQLPVCAYCSGCKLDGWFNEPKVQTKESERPDDPPNLFECTVCLDIVHPTCAEGPGKVNPELNNSWECSKCMNSGYSVVASRLAKKRKISCEEDEHQASSTRMDDGS